MELYNSTARGRYEGDDTLGTTNKIYETITAGELQSLRRDMVYETRERAGLGMVNIKEEYERNRLRVLKQIIEG